jgi:hypothetical protein
VTLVETYRVAIFVPTDEVGRLLAAVRRVTDLRYGNYLGVSWTSAEGDERFTPVEGATPSVGSVGRQEVVRLSRVEFSLPRDKELLHRVITTSPRYNGSSLPKSQLGRARHICYGVVGRSSKLMICSAAA